jgi:hypothetical protein
VKVSSSRRVSRGPCRIALHSTAAADPSAPQLKFCEQQNFSAVIRAKRVFCFTVYALINGPPYLCASEKTLLLGGTRSVSTTNARAYIFGTTWSRQIKIYQVFLWALGMTHTYFQIDILKKNLGEKIFPGGSDPQNFLGVTILPAGQSA